MTRLAVVLLALALVAAPLASFAQNQVKVWRVGFLAARHVDSQDSDMIALPPFDACRQPAYTGDGEHMPTQVCSGG